MAQPADGAEFRTSAAIVATLLAAAGRITSLTRNARLKPRSSLASAIGIKHPRIAQKAQGAMGGSFNTREFFHGRSPLALRNVKWLFILAGSSSRKRIIRKTSITR